MSYTPKNKG